MTNTIINNINADIISKANEANKAETERIVNTYQQMWGNGDSFIANDMAFLFGGAQRSGLNDDEEMAAAVKAAETDLIYKVIIKTWFKDMSRADAVAICNKLFGSRDSIQIFFCNTNRKRCCTELECRAQQREAHLHDHPRY